MNTSRTGRAFEQVRRLWSELDYAQRRLLEIRTGIPFGTEQMHTRKRAEIDELEALYAADDGRLA